MPVVLMGTSLLYFLYVLSQGDTKMIGDEIGGDPGSMMLPLILSIGMFVTSAYLFYTERTAGEKSQQMTIEEKHLFTLTMVTAFLYVAAIRFLGFIPCTCMLLFTLCFANLEKDVRKEDVGKFVSGNLFSLISVLLVYTFGRSITRVFLRNSRKGILPAFFGSTGFIILVVFLMTTLIVSLVVSACRKRWHEDNTDHRYWVSITIAFATTEYLYIVFKQMFMVELVKGIIIW